VVELVTTEFEGVVSGLLLDSVVVSVLLVCVVTVASETCVTVVEWFFDLVIKSAAATPPIASASRTTANDSPSERDRFRVGGSEGGGGGVCGTASVGQSSLVTLSLPEPEATGEGDTGGICCVAASVAVSEAADVAGAAAQPSTEHPALSFQQSRWCAARHSPQTMISAPSLSGNRQYGHVRPAMPLSAAHRCGSLIYHLAP